MAGWLRVYLFDLSLDLLILTYIIHIHIYMCVCVHVCVCVDYCSKQTAKRWQVSNFSAVGHRHRMCRGYQGELLLCFINNLIFGKLGACF